MNLKNIIEHPKTVDEAVDKMLVILTDDDKEQIIASTKDDLVCFHFSLGKSIRNSFGLNSGNAKLLGNRCADDVSMEIIEKVWMKLKQPWNYKLFHKKNVLMIYLYPPPELDNYFLPIKQIYKLSVFYQKVHPQIIVYN